ncbi:glycosyltransferase family 4 protein [Salinivibrio sp. KP-1]|uniref:glycosyltransferase family 4 protein n=1 Tax=Salinivibrio sp. KP-1 TaxID=1406902 RepID=UPI0006148581|nr:glycosyltransferase family 4 protein [Salinivibrio sp. KP-1]KKA44117.1 hypothetical protein WN56_12940 [Salinivibrio sp. KP-1]
MNVNVLQVCYVYPPSFSGYGKQLETVNSYFESSNDVHIIVITGYQGNSKSNVFSFHKKKRKSIEKEKLDYYAFAFLSPFKFFRKLFECDVVHIIKAGPEIIIWTFLAKILGKKVIIKVAQDEVENYKSKNIFRKLRYKTMKMADIVIALSSKIENELNSIGVRYSSVLRINNAFRPIDNEDGFSVLSPDEKNSDSYVISFVGSLCKRKGVDDLLKALARYNKNKKITLLLIGPDYGDIEDLNSLINEVNKNPMCSVHALGERSDAKNIIAESDMLCLPSYSEGMPNVVIEALSLGVPVLASNIPVVFDMINDFNGKIHNTGDVNDILLKINEMVEYKYNRNRIKEHAQLLFSIESVGRKYRDIYLKLGSS